VRHEDQKELLLNLGADLVINSETEKLQKLISEHTGEGVSVVFDAVGGVLGAKALASLKQGGKMMVFGLLSLENIPLNSGLMIFKNLKIEGFWLSSWMESLSDNEKLKAIQVVFGFLIQHAEKVDVAGRFPLERFKEAIEEYERPGRNGKILLVS
jgi:NADPH:quinone reductase-like Zn-dependent oxidoreductase